ncbi:MAG: carotenoid biosynthesis protein [Thermaurantimonas sp.]
MKKAKDLIKSPDNALLLLITLMHLWALFAFNQPGLRKIFLPLTPLNLLLCSVIAFRSYQGTLVRTFGLLIGVYLIGFLVELIGVNTGFPFGNYTYGSPLGPQVWNTPLIIGLNWYILFSGILYLIERTRLPILIKSLLGAGLMTGADILIEPVAIFLDFWTWENALPPSENYIGWFGVSLTMFLMYYRFFKSVAATRNAFWVVCIFVMFFMIQNLIL